MEILWWHWLVLGLALAVAEMASSGGFYIIFFGIGALIVGGLAAFNLAGPPWMQVLLFSVLSVGGLAVFRGRLLRAVQPNPQTPMVDALVGEVAIADEDVPAGSVGRVELRGTTWSARNETGVSLTRGARCRVTRVDGLMLYIVPEGVR